MKVIKHINNNAVLCVDGSGNQVVALGKGLSQHPVSAELDLDQVDRTFYDVEPRYIDLMRDLPSECLNLAAGIADAARSLLPYELSPNIDIALADHIAFALKRAQEGLFLQAPLAYDIQQNYPIEYKIAEFGIKRIKAQLGVSLPKSETTGIAMSIINSAYTAPAAAPHAEGVDREALLEQISNTVEQTMETPIDREGFGFARFATHIQYLLQRVESGEAIETENSGAYPALAESNPQAAACVDAIAELIAATYHQTLTEEERLYLILHVNRICTRSDRLAALR